MYSVLLDHALPLSSLVSEHCEGDILIFRFRFFVCVLRAATRHARDGPRRNTQHIKYPLRRCEHIRFIVIYLTLNS